MKTYFVVFVALLVSFCVSAQENTAESAGYYPDYEQLEVKPTFNGGDHLEFTKWVNKRLVYPENALRKGIEGVVRFRIVVDEKGHLSEIELLEMPDPELAQEAMRVMTMSPKWTPAMIDGKPVKTEFTFPVKFMIKRENIDLKKDRADRNEERNIQKKNLKNKTRGIRR